MAAAVRQVFGFEVPAELPGVPAKVLNPREAWSDKKGYDATRTKLAGMFKENFTKFVKVNVADESSCCRIEITVGCRLSPTR